MIEKTWLQQDYILIGLTRLHIMLILIGIVAYTAIWYAIGKGWHKWLYDMWMIRRHDRKLRGKRSKRFDPSNIYMRLIHRSSQKKRRKMERRCR